MIARAVAVVTIRALAILKLADSFVSIWSFWLLRLSFDFGYLSAVLAWKMHHYWKVDFHFYCSLLLCCCSNSCKIVRLHCSYGRIGRSNRHHCHAFSRNRSCGGTHYAKYGLCCLSSTVVQRCQFQYRNYSYFPNYDAYDP